MAGTANAYNGHDLQTDSIITSEIDHHSGPNKKQPMYGIGHANYSTIPFINFPSKQIYESGILVANSIVEMDTLIDTFKGYFITKDKYLDIGHAGGTRRYLCTPQSPQIKRPGGLTQATWSIVFDCTLPFGRDVSSITALNETGRTAHLYADNYTFLGSAPWQYPIVTITFTAITGGTGATVSFGNNANGQQCSVTRNWATNDVLQISSDPLDRFVKVNGAWVDWAGAIPEFDPGSQYMAYSDTFSAVTFNENIIYYPMWM